LLLFDAMSGLKVNLAKRVLIPIIEVLDLHHLAQFFSCGVDFLRSSYLGLLLRASYKCKVVFEQVLKSLKEAGWVEIEASV